MTALLLILFILLALVLLPRPRSGIVRVRQKSAREEAMHDQIQQAMNWRPEHFQKREDGRWFNAYGAEATCYTLEELMAKIETEQGR